MNSKLKSKSTQTIKPNISGWFVFLRLGKGQTIAFYGKAPLGVVLIKNC
jgi:hypothetical protein